MLEINEELAMEARTIRDNKGEDDLQTKPEEDIGQKICSGTQKARQVRSCVGREVGAWCAVQSMHIRKLGSKDGSHPRRINRRETPHLLVYFYTTCRLARVTVLSPLHV